MKKILLVALPLAFVGALCWLSGTAKSQTTDVVLIGAGDIADAFAMHLSDAFATAALIDANPTATVFADGDLPHSEGTDADYAKAYAPTWGRFRARTIPVTGNHEYAIQDAVGYFNYWGPVAGNPTQGWYSLDLGSWHIIVLNSNCGFVGCAAGGAQETWLRNDLAAHTQACTLALFHEPLYTSSTIVAPNPDVQPLWQDLYNANADLVVNGHAHNYERFAPQDASGNLDPARGIIEIISGTGGASHFPFNTTMAPNSLIGDAATFGVLKLTLHASSFDWQFLPVAGQTFTDSGTQTCH